MGVGEMATRQVQKPQADLGARMQRLHEVIRFRYDFVDRMAMAIYDPRTDLLKTFVSSNTDGLPLRHYSARLADVPSLRHLADTRSSRVVQQMSKQFSTSTSHTAWLIDQGYVSSYTVPVFEGDELAAFLFFDSKQPQAFSDESQAFLDVFADLIAQLYLLELRAVRSLVGTVHVASGLAQIRDTETGQHLLRMASYARLIGQHLAAPYALEDEFIEYLHLFAPLHDIGKVGIPDRVLLKPGRLDEAEWAIMQQHVSIGEQLVEQMVDDMGLEDGLARRVLRNIVATHHERGDGSGYPRGLKLADIPLEGRIVAVADVFDALSCQRPYKRAWTRDEVVAELTREVASGRLDADCVRVILAAQTETADIQHRFAD